jgi:cytoskeletal protein CcmA (bactofilin family)
MKKIFFVLALLSVAMFPVVVHGAQFVSSKNGDYSLNVNNVVSENLYVGAKNVNISGKAQNDLFAAGANVIITGEVGQDIAVAGGMVSVSGKIGDDARIAGGSITVDGNIGGDLLVAGGTVDLLTNLKVGKSVMLFGGDITLAGMINGPTTIYSKNTYINGTINGDLNVKGQDVTLGPNALIKGNFNYSAAQEASIMTGAQILGEKHFTKIEVPQIGPATGMMLLGFMSAWWLLKLFMLLVSALIAYYAFKEGSRELVKYTVNNFWMALLRGFVLFFIIPIAIIIALVTIVGIIPALVAALIYAIMLMLGTVFGGIVIAGLISKWLLNRPDYRLDWYAIVLGVFIYQLLKVVPFVGWILSAAVFLAALGALYSGLYIKFEPRKK